MKPWTPQQVAQAASIAEEPSKAYRVNQLFLVRIEQQGHVSHLAVQGHLNALHLGQAYARERPTQQIRVLNATGRVLYLANVLTYFDHRITTATCEGVNNKIQAIKHSAFGFRNRDHFRTAMSMLDFYINRAGRNLSATEREALEKTKVALRKRFGETAN